MNAVHNRVNGKPDMGKPSNEPQDSPSGEDNQNTTGQPQPSPLDPMMADLAELAASAAHYMAARRDLVVSPCAMPY